MTSMKKMKKKKSVIVVALITSLGLCNNPAEGLQLVPPPPPKTTIRKSGPLSYSNDVAADPTVDPSNPLVQLVSKLHDPNIRFRVISWPKLDLKIPDETVKEVAGGNYFQKGQEAAMKAIRDVMAQYNIGGGGGGEEVAKENESNFLQKGQEAALKAIRDIMALYNTGDNSHEEGASPPIKESRAVNPNFQKFQRKDL